MDDARETEAPARAERASDGPGTSAPSPRRAVATSRITMQATTAASVASNSMKKGDVLGTARFAGVQAAKDADSYLPFSDPVLVNNVTVRFSIEDDHIDVEASVDSPGGSGVEMQALTAATVAALTVYDMCKSADRTMTIGPVSLQR